MKKRLRKFIEILKIELQDLEEDITDLEKLTKERGARKELTPYVTQENTALLKRELRGVTNVMESLDHMDCESFTSLDAAVPCIVLRLHEHIENLQFPHVVQLLVDRKIEKVKRYIDLS